MYRFKIFISAIFVYLITMLGVVGCSDSPTSSQEKKEQAINWSAAADSSSNALINNYWNSGEGYFNYGNRGNTEFHYWPQAHALDVMLDAYQRTSDSKYKQIMDQWYQGVPQQQGDTFLNDFYDDMEWNALAMLRAHQTVGDEKFLTSTKDVWEEIKTGWTDVGGGGIMWAKHTPRSKNAISNSPASILASRLYQLTGEEEYLDWAHKTYDFVKNNLVNRQNGAVWDHMEVSQDGEVDIQKDWIFTYNQGVFLGAALELYEITDESRYLNDAIKSADYTLNNLTDGNTRLLVDEGTGDGGLFKGIFVRYLTELILEEDLSESVRNRYVAFLEHNAETLWKEGTNKSNVLYSSFWNDKPANNAEIDLTVQLSGSMLIEAAALLDNEGLLSDE